MPTCPVYRLSTYKDLDQSLEEAGSARQPIVTIKARNGPHSTFNLMWRLARVTRERLHLSLTKGSEPCTKDICKPEAWSVETSSS